MEINYYCVSFLKDEDIPIILKEEFCDYKIIKENEYTMTFEDKDGDTYQLFKQKCHELFTNKPSVEDILKYKGFPVIIETKYETCQLDILNVTKDDEHQFSMNDIVSFAKNYIFGNVKVKLHYKITCNNELLFEITK